MLATVGFPTTNMGSLCTELVLDVEQYQIRFYVDAYSFN